MAPTFAKAFDLSLHQPPLDFPPWPLYLSWHKRFEADQAARRARNLPVYPIDEKFMQALERGLSPCAGNALGLDRLVALACGTTDIREVLAFSAGDV